MPIEKVPSEDDWEAHRSELEELYSTRKWPLRKVKTHMEEHYDFFAKKNQYEKYLKGKWKHAKKTKAVNWHAIIPRLLDLKYQGKRYEVWIDGKKIEEKTLAQEMKRRKRHIDAAPAGSNSRPSAPELPLGVVIHELSHSSVPEGITEGLPFHSFEKPIYKYLRRVYESSHPRFDIALTDPESNPSNGRGEILDKDTLLRLQTVVYDTDSAVFPGATMGVYLESCLFAVLFSVANNFAGLETIPFQDVISFLELEAQVDLHQLLLLAPKHYTTQALAMNLFRASVEAGNARMVDRLLENSKFEINVNSSMCYWRGNMYTPIQRAAAMLRTEVVEVLLMYGANPGPTSDNLRSSGFHAAINFAAGYGDTNAQADRLARADLKLIDLLTEPPCVLLKNFLDELIRLDFSGTRVLLIISKWIFVDHQREMKNGTYHRIFQYQDERILPDVIETLKLGRVDLNLEYAASTGECYKEISPCRIIDHAAFRGHMQVVELLLTAGATLSEDTLYWAVRSGIEVLVRHILKFNVATDRMGSVFAAAGKVKNHRITNLIVQHSGKKNCEKELFHSVLKAASEVGNFKLLKQLQKHFTYSTGKQDLISLPNSLRGIKPPQDEDTIFLEFASTGAHDDADDDILEIGPPLHGGLSRRNAELVGSLDASFYNIDWSSGPEFCVGKSKPMSLRAMVEWGDYGAIRDLIKAGANVNSINNDTGYSFTSDTPINIAISRKDTKTVEIFIQSGYDINNIQAKQSNRTALRAAVRTGDLSIIESILGYGADPHDGDAILESVKHSPEVLDMLLKKHALRYPQGLGGCSWEALKFAIDEGNQDLFKSLLDSGADCSQGTIQNKNGVNWVTVFGYAISKANTTSTKFVELILQQKQYFSCKPESIVLTGKLNKWGRPRLQLTAFLFAIRISHLPIVELLLRYGADVNFQPEFGVRRTPLQEAARQGNIELVRLLIRRGADINASAAPNCGGTALQFAASRGYICIVRILLQYGANINAPGLLDRGGTALEQAAQFGRLDMVALFLQVNPGLGGSGDGELERAMALAMRSHHYSIVDMLRRFRDTGGIRSEPISISDFPYTDVKMESEYHSSEDETDVEIWAKGGPQTSRWDGDMVSLPW